MSVVKFLARKILFPLITDVVQTHKSVLKNCSKHYVVVNFHGVSNVKGHRFNNRHFDVGDFERTLVYLKDCFDIVPLEQLYKMREQGMVPAKKTIALTFDDGYLNNFTVALPILKKMNVPATFFMITKGLVDKDYIVWPDMIDLVMKEAEEDIVLDGKRFVYPGYHCDEIGKTLVDFLKEKGKGRDVLVEELAQKYPLYQRVRKENPQLIELIRGEEFAGYVTEPLIEYGSHTHQHYNLEYLSDANALEEMKESARILSSYTGKPVECIAFPDGSYSPATLEIAFSCGYKRLLIVEDKFAEMNKVKGVLSRFTISNSTTPQSNIQRLARQFDRYGF